MNRHAQAIIRCLVAETLPLVISIRRVGSHVT
jgi:hypothetical protein